MAAEADPAELVGRQPDPQLLGPDAAQVPQLGPLVVPEPSAARRVIVGAGALLTGLSLTVGVLLIVLAAVEALASGWATRTTVVLGAGLVLVATHWGWVHVAELIGQSLQSGRAQQALEANLPRLRLLEPYTRFSVSTEPAEDGGLRVLTWRHDPVASGADTFTFRRELEAQEHHGPDEPAATITERAEILRRRAAEATEHQRQRHAAARDAYDRARIKQEDEAQRREAARAASAALSEQLNAHMRDPPLTE